MFGEISLKSLRRSPLKTILLCFLIVLVTVFLILGISMFNNSNQLLKQADETYHTLGIVEYTAGGYPDETDMPKEAYERLAAFDKEKVTNQEEVKEFHDMSLMLGYADGLELSNYFQLPYYNYSVIKFKVMYIMEDGNYRCVLLDSMYSNTGKPGTMFGLSKETLENMDEYNLKKDHVYMGNGDFRKEATLLFCPIADCGIEGEDNPGKHIKGFPLAEIKEDEEIADNPDMAYWEQICDYYRVQNNSLPVMATDSLNYQRDFFLGSNSVSGGRVWTEEEGAAGEKVCLINQATANQLGKKIGDTLTMSIHYSPNPQRFYDSYSTRKGFEQTTKYKVLGIYKTLQSSADSFVYVPQASIEQLPENQENYYIGTVELKNGTKKDYEEKIGSMMKDHFRLAIYDEGYDQTVAPIYAMRNNAVLIMVLCSGCAAAIIILFATLFIVKQQETIAVMTALGTGKKKIRKYLMIGAGVIAGVGSLLGALIAYFSSEQVIEFAYRLSKANHQRDLRFSSLAMGNQKTFDGTISSSIGISLLLALLLFAATMLLCIIFSNRVIALTANFGGQIKKKKKDRKKEQIVNAAEAPRATFQFKEIEVTEKSFHRWTRFLFLWQQSMRSLRRNAKVGVVLLAVTCAISLFMIFFADGIAGYKMSLDEAYRQFDVEAYYATIAGQPLNAHSVNEEVTQYMEKSRNVEKAYRSTSYQYEYIGALTSKHGDSGYDSEIQQLIDKEGETMTYPKTGFGMEKRLGEIKQDNNLVMTDAVERAEEFFLVGKPKIQYLIGYDHIFEKQQGNFLSDESENEKLPVVEVLAAEDILKKNKLKLGDEAVVAQILPFHQNSTYLHQPVLCRIVGSYVSSVGEDSLYFPTREDSLAIKGTTWNGRVKEFVQTPNFINYRLKNVENLTLLRDGLIDRGISPVGVFGEARVAVVIEDKELVQAVDSLKNNISFMESLRYVLFLLVFIIGFVVSYLTMRTRREELAIIRSMGTGKVRTFLVFFIEQLAVGAIGAVLGIGAAVLALGNLTAPELQSVALFYLFFMLGSGICVARMNRKNVLAILSGVE